MLPGSEIKRSDKTAWDKEVRLFEDMYLCLHRRRQRHTSTILQPSPANNTSTSYTILPAHDTCMSASYTILPAHDTRTPVQVQYEVSTQDRFVLRPDIKVAN